MDYFGDRRTDLSVGKTFQGVETPSQVGKMKWCTFWIVILRQRETENELSDVKDHKQNNNIYVVPCEPSFSVKSVSQGLFQFEKARPVAVAYDIHVL